MAAIHKKKYIKKFNRCSNFGTTALYAVFTQLEAQDWVGISPQVLASQTRALKPGTECPGGPVLGPRWLLPRVIPIHSSTLSLGYAEQLSSSFYRPWVDGSLSQARRQPRYRRKLATSRVGNTRSSDRLTTYVQSYHSICGVTLSRLAVVII